MIYIRNRCHSSCSHTLTNIFEQSIVPRVKDKIFYFFWNVKFHGGTGTDVSWLGLDAAPQDTQLKFSARSKEVCNSSHPGGLCLNEQGISGKTDSSRLFLTCNQMILS